MDKLTSRSFRKKRRRRTNKTIIKRIFDFFGNLIISFLIIVVGFSIYGNIQINGRRDRVPSIASYMWMSVLSNSMKPVFSTGDLIIDRKVGVRDLKDGDIITFVRGSSLATHRISEVIKDDRGNIRFKTKGDNNNVVDLEAVNSNKVIGKYIFKIPYAGFIFAKTKGLAGIILIWVMFISVVGTEIYRSLKARGVKSQRNYNLANNN